MGVRGPHIETTSRGRFYVWKKERYWSVTTIIDGGVPKPALVGWAKKVTAEYAVGHIDALQTLVADDPDGAIDWLKGAAYRDRDRSAALGSLVHDASEAYVLERPYPEWTEAQAPYMEGLVHWIEDFAPTFTAVEAPCFSPRHRYAGTLDAIVQIDGRTWLVDYKTGKDVYPEVGLQLAAYRNAETFLGLPDGSEGPLPAIDATGVVHLHPRHERGYQFVPVRTDETVFTTFLYVREVFRWQQEIAKGVVGVPMAPGQTLDPVEAMEREVTIGGIA